MKNPFKKFRKIILPIIAFISFLIVVIPDLFENTRCNVYDEFLSTAFEGVVVQKFIDSSQHSNKVVTIKDQENSRIQRILFDLEINHAFEKIKINDTLVKENGKDSIFKIKNSKKTFLTVVDFGCKN